MISLCFDEEQGAGGGYTGSPSDLENSKWVEEQGAGRGHTGSPSDFEKQVG